jgi:hypothetical protein
MMMIAWITVLYDSITYDDMLKCAQQQENIEAMKVMCNVSTK